MIDVLFAQDAPKQEVPFFLSLPFMTVMLVLFWVIIILPMGRRQKKEQAALQTSLKRGVRVATTSGIIGTIVSLKDNEDEMTIRSEDSKLKVLKSSVARVLGSDEGEAK